MKNKLLKEKWRHTINLILDGKNAAEIERIGSSTEYIKDRLFASTDINHNTEVLEKVLGKLIARFSFTAEDALSKPAIYEYLINWIIAFLPHKQKYWVRLFGLLNDLEYFRGHGELQDKNSISKQFNHTYEKIGNALLTQFNSTLNRRRLENRPTDFHDTLVKQRQRFVEIMRQTDFSNAGEKKSLLAIRSIIYLQSWNLLIEEERRKIVEFVCRTENLNIQNMLINDMANANIESVPQFSLFSDDCFKYCPTFYNFIAEFSPQWKVKPGSISMDEIMTEMKTTKAFSLSVFSAIHKNELNANDKFEEITFDSLLSKAK